MVTNRAKPGLEVPAFAGNMKGVGLASALFAGGLGMLVSTRGVVSARSGTVASIGMRSFILALRQYDSMEWAKLRLIQSPTALPHPD